MAVMAVMVVMVVEEGVWVRAGPLGASGRAEGRAAEKAMEETGWDVGKGSCFEEPMRAWSGGTTRLKSSLAVAAAALV